MLQLTESIQYVIASDGTKMIKCHQYRYEWEIKFSASETGIFDKGEEKNYTLIHTLSQLVATNTEAVNMFNQDQALIDTVKKKAKGKYIINSKKGFNIQLKNIFHIENGLVTEEFFNEFKANVDVDIR